MRKGRGDYIAGRFVRARRGAEEFPSENPGDLADRIGVWQAVPEHVDDAVEAARAAFRAWAHTPLEERIGALHRIRAEIHRRADDLAHTLTREVGRPLWETRQEVATMQAKIDVTVGEALAEIAERRPPGLTGRLIHRPLGVVAVLAPFNFPGHLPHGQLLPAIVAGCTVVVKPSELTPAVGELYAEIIAAAELPRGVVNLIQGGPSIGDALVRHPDVAAVFFIGSWATGQRIRKATIEQPGKLLALEMGGKNAAIVLADADLDLAAHEIARSAYISAGQRCSSTCRVIAHKKIHDELLERLAHLARHIKVGYGMDEGVFMGPLVSRRAMARFLATVRRAEKAGAAEPVVPALPLSLPRRGHYVAPSLHLAKKKTGPAAREWQREELFGPNLAVWRAGDLDEAIALANDSDYGLCMSVYTHDQAAYEQVLHEGRAGVINWNRGTVGSSPRLPFGGAGKSGNHRPAGLFMIRACVLPVATLEHPTGHDDAALPPGMPTLPAKTHEPPPEIH